MYITEDFSSNGPHSSPKFSFGGSALILSCNDIALATIIAYYHAAIP